MPVKKSELYASLWSSCDQLRGGMDASQYKDYVLVLLFMKYVSDKYGGQPDAMLVVPAGGGFEDMLKLKGDKEIGDRMNKVVAALADANPHLHLRGVIDVVDFNDPDKLGKGRDMVDRLSNLVSIFASPSLDFRSNRAEGDDLLGDAYEYLMRNFASQSGKSKGQFYTPAEVSRVIARVIGLGGARSGSQSIYDPTCGSGSLLLKAHDEARAATGQDLTLYGQEMDNTTSALARMNMILHDCPTAEIVQDNTLSAPHWKQGDRALKTFDFVVANPPFSTKAWTNGLNPGEDAFGRFEFGVPPTKNGDYAFLLHILKSMKSTGKGACILPHGVLFRGGAEAMIRREIVRRGYIKGIIGLPANLFFGTGIPACILILDKEDAGARRGVFMIDASKGFAKDGNKNRLREQDIHRIVDTFNRQLLVPGYARLVPLAEIADAMNDFNLNLPRYIDASEPEDLHDIDAHLHGGIPTRDVDALDRYWRVMPALRTALFEVDPVRPGYLRLTQPVGALKSTILAHGEFAAFRTRALTCLANWQRTAEPDLRAVKVGDSAKRLGHALAESMLAAFGVAPLLDAYDVYQRFMDAWALVLQDDVSLVAATGWRANRDLIPATFIARRHFAEKHTEVERLETARDEAARAVEALDEEHAGDDGLLAEARTDKGKLTPKTVKDRLKALEAEGDPEAEAELTVLREVVKLMDAETAAARKFKEAQRTLEVEVEARYATLSADEVRDLVVTDKWLPLVETGVKAELERVSQTLTGRLRQLAERYVAPLPALTQEVERLSGCVEEHLRRMGFTV